MNERTKTPEPQPVQNRIAGSGADLDETREQAAKLLAFGAAAIRSALSKDSEDFLGATLQQGGQ